MNDTKRKSYNYILIFVVTCEVLLVLFLVVKVYERYRANTINKNMVTTVVPIKKDYLITSSSAELQYFYEPPPNEIQTDSPQWLEYVASYNINADTLNDNSNYKIQKPSHTFRIVALGDSFTFGHYVNTEDNWTEKLERKLNALTCKDINNFEIINLGERGYDVRYNAHRYKLRGEKYNPDLLIYMESGTGFSRVHETLDPLVSKHVLGLTDDEKENIKKNPNIDYAQDKAIKEFFETYTKETIDQEIGAAWHELFEYKGNIPLIITAFSNLHEEDEKKMKNWILNRPNIYFYSTIPVLFEHEGLLPDNHPNIKGHEIMATSILETVRNINMIQCNNK